MPAAAALALRTDQILLDSSDAEPHDGYTVVRTPSNPSFFWGNFIAFDRAPQAGDATRWPRLFDAHIGSRQPQSRHWAFRWIEDAAGDVQPFVDAGCTVLESVVMTAHALPPCAPRAPVQLRALAGADWEALYELQMIDRPSEHPLEAYAPYKRQQVAHWRRLAESGRGAWFGAFAGSALVATMGIYAEAARVEGLRLARYQHVITHPGWRRQRLCRALLAVAADYALTTLAADLLVIVADAHDVARHVYAAAGFADHGICRGLQRIGY